MNKTARIITTVAAMALTIAIMCVGILAATKVTLTSGSSTISFTASSDVSATVTATKKMGTDTAQDLTVAENGVFLPSTSQGQEYSGSIELGDITFTSTDATFTLTITVANTFTAESSKVNAKYSVTCANNSGYLVIATTTADGAFTSGDTKEIAYDSSVTFTTTISIDSSKVNEVLESGISEAFSFSLELTKATASA